jgi:hypothetical protein
MLADLAGFNHFLESLAIPNSAANASAARFSAASHAP